jgi:TonB family protein
MVCVSGIGAQQPSGAGGDGKAQRNDGLEILSDTQGVDFKPYLKVLMREVYTRWIPLIPAEAKAPQNQKGFSVIRFAINPDGTIASMHLDDSSGDEELNRAAWGALSSAGKEQPLPTEFHGPDLELRITFLVNQTTK